MKTRFSTFNQKNRSPAQLCMATIPEWPIHQVLRTRPICHQSSNPIIQFFSRRTGKMLKKTGQNRPKAAKTGQKRPKATNHAGGYIGICISDFDFGSRPIFPLLRFAWAHRPRGGVVLGAQKVNKKVTKSDRKCPKRLLPCKPTTEN